jgi:hypothetical protein
MVALGNEPAMASFASAVVRPRRDARVQRLLCAGWPDKSWRHRMPNAEMVAARLWPAQAATTFGDAATMERENGRSCWRFRRRLSRLDGPVGRFQDAPNRQLWSARRVAIAKRDLGIGHNDLAGRARKTGV